MSLLQNLGAARRFRIRRKDAHYIQPANPRPQRRDCQGQLLAALEEMAGPDSAIDDAGMRPWCSATFVGAQHRIMLRLTGEDAAQQVEALSTRLREAEFTLRGHIVADLSVDDVAIEPDGAVLINLAVLTIEDW
jgi:hypothetical protein